MAYVSQELKTQLVAAVKAELAKVLKGDKLKVTFSVRHHSEIVATISEGTIDFGTTYQQVNHYYIDNHFSGKAAEVLNAIKRGLSAKHWDESDAMTDYFNCAYYMSINIGKWNKGYETV